ncbi:hypothetical protein F5Y19DRAFT_476654 [Xylariaceae sp. FL1651]|nr:hypothetical protein F5Y19DRAFT_476654 [Xylariaceae sp. FL1651]
MPLCLREFAGVVLGGIPIIISLLEGYTKVAEASRVYRSVARHVRVLCQELETERLVLQNTCEKVLTGLVPPYELTAMIVNPGAWWKDSIGDKVSSRLGGTESRDAFASTAATIRETIDEIRNTIGLDLKGEVSFTLTWRLSFVRKRSELELLIGKLRRANSRLSQLLPRYPVCHGNEEDVIKKILINFALSFHADGRHDPNMPWCLDEIDLGIVDISDTPTLVPRDTCLQATTPSVPKSKVRFGISDSMLATHSQRVRTGSSRLRFSTGTLGNVDNATSAVLAPEIGKKFPRITNLCSAISQAQSQQEPNCHGYIADISTQTHTKFGVYTFGSPSALLWTIVSLKDVLADRGQSLRPLTYRHKITLAPLIASSVIQLLNSSWLSEPITSRDIFFIRSTDTVIYDSVYISGALPDKNSPSIVAASTRPSFLNRSLVALGTLLTELALGHLIDHDGQTALTDMWTDWYTSTDLLERVKSEGDVNFYAAVKRCVRCEFQCPVLDLEQISFRQEVYNTIVGPLEENVDPVWS